MEEMKVYTHEEMLDRVVGTKDTPARKKYDTDINNFLIGEAIKRAREAKNLTQEQLGELMGVKRAQISKIENGKNLTMETIMKVFKALDVDAKIHIGSRGVDIAMS